MTTKFLQSLRNRLRRALLGGDLKVILEAVRSSSVAIRTLATELSRLRATTTNLTMLVNATRTDTKGLKQFMSTQESRLQRHEELLRIIGDGVEQIIEITNSLRAKNENPAISDELDRMELATAALGERIKNFLNPPVATGEAVPSATGEPIPVNSGNEHLIIGGTTSSTPTISEPGAVGSSSPSDPQSAPTIPEAETVAAGTSGDPLGT